MAGFSLGTILGIGSLFIGGASLIAGYNQSSNAADAAEQGNAARARADKLLQKKNDLSVRRQKLATIREGRIKRAQAVSSSQTKTGGVQQGIGGSAISQTNSAVGFVNQAQQFTLGARRELAQSTIFNNQSIGFSNNANIFNGIASLSGSIFENRKGLSRFAKEVGIA